MFIKLRITDFNWGPLEGMGGSTCSIVHLKQMGLFPCSQKSEICFLMLPDPQYCLRSPYPLNIWPLFPCSPDINAILPCSPEPLGKPLIWVCCSFYETIFLLLVWAHKNSAFSYIILCLIDIWGWIRNWIEEFWVLKYILMGLSIS